MWWVLSCGEKIVPPKVSKHETELSYQKFQSIKTELSHKKFQSMKIGESQGHAGREKLWENAHSIASKSIRVESLIDWFFCIYINTSLGKLSFFFIQVHFFLPKVHLRDINKVCYVLGRLPSVFLCLNKFLWALEFRILVSNWPTSIFGPKGPWALYW